MKKIFPFIFFVVFLLSTSVASAAGIIINADIPVVKANIIQFMMKKYNDAIIVADTENSITFNRQSIGDPLAGEYNLSYYFTFFRSENKTILNFNGKLFRSNVLANTSRTANQKEINNFISIIKFCCDGRYVFGFDLDGLKVKSVTSNSLAAKAGLKVGDKIKTINGVKVKKEDLYFIGVNNAITMVVKRDDNEVTIVMEGTLQSGEEYKKLIGI